MLFNSFEFLVFLPCVIILYYILPHKIRWVLLLAASYYFYMAWKAEYIILIVISTLVDYFASILMEKQNTKGKRRIFLFLSLFVNLGLLFVFKYYNFFMRELGDIYSLVSHSDNSFIAHRLLLPMGISFYTFQTLSYTIDVYRGNRKAERHLGYFALYVTFFPQLVAGPIERSDRLLPQLKEKHKFDYDNFVAAIMRIMWGFFKKVVIADRVAVLVNAIYNDVYSYSGVYLIIATLGFAIQIYCDFSAYSDIAIGSAKLMGVDLMENFKMPYLSKCISEFWSRWHISLSTWFKDYLYIPLGGNRVNKRWKYYRNLMITFLVSGLWHGANWTFIAWGLLHGGYQVVERFFGDISKKMKKSFTLPKILKTTITFILVLFAWIFFRANNIGDAAYIVQNINFNNINAVFSSSFFELGLDVKEVYLLILCVVWLAITDFIKYRQNTQIIIKRNIPQLISILILAMFIIVFGYYGANQSSDFIYFQF